MTRSTHLCVVQRIAVFGAVALGGCAGTAVRPTGANPEVGQRAAVLEPFEQEIPVAAYRIPLAPVPGSPDGAIRPFFISRTEVPWEAFDVFIYRLDEQRAKAPKGADAVTRPSKPYLPPDRGFGHEGFPAISMSHKNATEFCKWLSAATGRPYRLPTEAEWEWAARATPVGEADPRPTGTAVASGALLGDCAWMDANSADGPHAVGKKRPNALGLYDVLGNAAEWVDGTDGKPVTKGGSFRDPADSLTVSGRAPQDRSWNASDPQVPKSKWWLADAPFVGFRIVCEVSPAGATAQPPPPRQSENRP